MVTNEQTPAQLRTYPPLRSIFPFEAMVAAATCPECGCPKSGNADVPNSRQECCEDAACRCHEDASDYPGSVSLAGDS
ncbi:MAG: hypothetical protein V1912_11270 [bacterium]